MDKPNHVSLDRPKVAPLEGGLPPGAIPYGTRSSWPLIVTALWERRGVWHEVERLYTTPASPLHQARKWCDYLLPNGASESLEVAFRPLPNSRVQVYMRIRAEGQAPLLPEDDDEDEEVEVTAIEPEPEPSGNRREGSLLAPTVERDASGRAVLSPSQVRSIRLRVEAGEMQKDVAHDYGLSESTVSNIVNRKTYTNINGDEE